MRRAGSVSLRIRARPLADAARCALAAGGIPIGAELPGDPALAPVIVVGWPSVGASEQRRRARDAVRRARGGCIVVVADRADRTAIRRLLADGVHGVVLASEVEATLAVTVRAVASGQLCVPQDGRAAVAPAALSVREREILALVVMGLRNAEIARRLHLAESTVKSHLASTFTKLGVRSRAEAIELVSDPQEMLSSGIVGLSGAARR
jgi:DNA-binding NarL/FixJ family response regulator